MGFSLSTGPSAASSGGPRVPGGVTVCLVWTIGYRGAPDVRPEKGPLGYVTTVRNRCWTVRTRRLCKALPCYLRYSCLGMTATGGLRPGFGCLGMPKCLAEDGNPVGPGPW